MQHDQFASGDIGDPILMLFSIEGSVEMKGKAKHWRQVTEILQ